MKHPVEHRCTACGTVVGQTTRRRTTVGRPFEECPKCATLVARPPYDEWALMSPVAKLETLSVGGAIALAIGLLPGLLFGIFAFVGRTGTDVRNLQILAGLGVIVALGVWGLCLVRTVRRSQNRVSDPWYKAKLVKFGMQAQRAEE